MNHRREQRHGGGRPALVVYCVCAVYMYCLGALVAWAAVPVLTGLQPTLIVSGSMAPTINTGDVVLIGSARHHTVRPGNVVTFQDPSRPERLLTHRVVAMNPDGTFRTRGDANAKQDSAQIGREHIRGVGRVLVPAVGLPIVWIRAAAWVQLVLWLLGTFIALAYLRAHDRWVPMPASWSSPLAETAPVRDSRPRHTSRPDSVRTPVIGARAPRARSAIAAVIVLAVAALVVPRIAPSAAAFTTTAGNAENAWAAGTSFCNEGQQILGPTADARVTDTITTPAGAVAGLSVKNKNNLERSLLQFNLPSVAACTVTATLRLYTTSGATGQTLRTRAAAAAWNEASVIWSTQPAMTGPTTDQASVASGWVEFDVSAFVADLAAGTYHGFVVHDAGESGGGPPKAQVFASRESATNTPQLVLNLFATPPPAAPTGLTATPASSTRVDLAWSDSSGGTAGTRIERSPAGAGTWTTVDNVGAGTSAFTDTGLAPSTSYDYRVRATNGAGVSSPSNVATATTPAAPAPPVAPSGLTATPRAVDQIDLSWTDVAANEDGYTVQRSPAGAASWATVATTGPDATALTDAQLLASTAYDYRVRAFNGGGTSTWTAVATATTAACATLPDATLMSIADSTVFSGTYADTNFGADAGVYYIYSMTGTNGRALVEFPAPTIRGGCAITSATLRLNAQTGTVGRTLQAYTVAEPWGEMAVTWNTQPATTGVPVTTASGTGWRQWDVTGLVGASGAGVEHGLLLRDATEDAATAQSQLLSPREGANPPQLVIGFD